MRATFIRLLHAEAKDSALCSAAKSGGPSRYLLEPKQFTELPTSPFAYWIGDGIRHAFRELEPFEADGRTARQGLATSDDFRFVRCWFEVAAVAVDWRPTAKGGRFARFYCDLQASSNWRFSGSEMKAFAETRPGVEHWSKRITNTNMYYQPGITWPLRGLNFSAQAVPAGAIFTIAGKMAFAPSGELLTVLGVLNSSAFDGLMKLFAGKAGGVQYESGLIQRTPVPGVKGTGSVRLSELAHAGWSARRSLDTVVEVSHAFVMPALLQVDGSTCGLRVMAWTERVAAVEAELAHVQSEVDDLCFELYGISEEDRRALADGAGVGSDADEEDDSGAHAADVDGGEMVDLDPAELAAGLVSWAVGVAVGRFDLRLATGERSWTEEPDPFDPLPVCPLGMLTGDDGLPLVTMPPEYRVEMSPVLVDDPGHRLDITGRVRSVFDAVFGGEADRWWADVGMALGAKGGESRWLAGQRLLRLSPEDVFKVATQSADPVADRDAIGILCRVALCASGISRLVVPDSQRHGRPEADSGRAQAGPTAHGRRDRSGGSAPQGDRRSGAASRLSCGSSARSLKRSRRCGRRTSTME